MTTHKLYDPDELTPSEDQKRAHRIARRIMAIKEKYHRASGWKRRARLKARFDILVATHKAIVDVYDAQRAQEQLPPKSENE